MGRAGVGAGAAGGIGARLFAGCEGAGCGFGTGDVGLGRDAGGVVVQPPLCGGEGAGCGRVGIGVGAFAVGAAGPFQPPALGCGEVGCGLTGVGTPELGPPLVQPPPPLEAGGRLDHPPCDPDEGAVAGGP